MSWEAARQTIAATDFFSVEVWTLGGLTTYYVLFFIELSTRRVEIAGITPNPDAAYVAQMARNLTDCEDGFLRSTSHLIHDRDSKYKHQLLDMLNDAGVQGVRLPRRSPNLNAFAERFVRSVRDECLSRLILFGERALRRALFSYLAHYHEERNHQGLHNALIAGETPSGLGPVECSERLGGLLKFYSRAA